MIPQRHQDSTYTANYIILQQDEYSKIGTPANYQNKLAGKEIKNSMGKLMAISYNKDGMFHYINSGGRFGTLAFQIVSSGSLTYRVYVSIDGVNWDDKCKTILYDYVDDKFELGKLSGGTDDKNVTDIFYFHVIGRLQFKIDVSNVKGDYYIIALD